MFKKILCISVFFIGIAFFGVNQASAGCCCNPRFCATWLQKGVQANLSYEFPGAEGEEVEIGVFGADTDGNLTCGELTGTLYCTPANGDGNGNGELAVLTSNSESNPQPCPTAAQVLVIDRDSIGKGSYFSMEGESYTFSMEDVNYKEKNKGQRNQLPFFKNNSLKRIVLPTGRGADKGWFALTEIPETWADAGPTDDGLRNFVGQKNSEGEIVVGEGLGIGNPPQKYLNKVAGVTPLKGAKLQDLVGQKICAVVHHNEIKVKYIKGEPLYGDLKGNYLGRVAFQVISVTENKCASSSLPQVEIEILDADSVCANVLYAGSPEDPGEVCVAEPEVTVPISSPSLGATGTFESGDCNDEGCTKSLIAQISPEDGQAACVAQFGQDYKFVDFIPDRFIGKASSTTTEEVYDYCVAPLDGGNIFNCEPYEGPVTCACPNTYPTTGVLNWSDFLLNSGYFNPESATGVEAVCESRTTISGAWRVTPFFMEAGNSLEVQRTNSEIITIYETEDCSNWGRLSEAIDFDLGENLVFKDGLLEVSLDPFPTTASGNCGEGVGPIRMCELLEDSNELGYLAHPITIPAGARLIFFNDSGNDCDHDDIGVVAIPVTTPPVVE